MYMLGFEEVEVEVEVEEEEEEEEAWEDRIARNCSTMDSRSALVILCPPCTPSPPCPPCHF